VPTIATDLRFADRVGAWKARWGIGRMSYLVPPGLYAVGSPGPDDPVVVTANYKMSYDLVRRELGGRSVWLLVLETYGINVWCAAGKGTFGTDEIVRRVTVTGLASVVRHRTLILPILGAPGVAAHQVARRSGFRVRYATIRAADLPEYLDNGMETTPAMRQLTFTARERLVLTPIELVTAARWAVPVTALLIVLSALFRGGFSLPAIVVPVALCAGTVLTGAVAAPVLLPWLPGRSFAVKGAVAGALWSVFFVWAGGGGANWLETASIFLTVTTVSAFLTLNYTGSTPFTSRSGVKKEMRLGLPVMAASLVIALLLWIAGRLF